MRENDTVRILKYSEDHVNGLARVIRVTTTGIYVTNTNMPFMGTYRNQYFDFSEVEVWGGKKELSLEAIKANVDYYDILIENAEAQIAKWEKSRRELYNLWEDTIETKWRAEAKWARSKYFF